MKIPSVSGKNLSFFVCGLLWGVVLAYIIGGIFLKKFIILEYKSNFTVNDTADKIAKNAVYTGRWLAKVSPCALPQPSDNTDVRIVTLCNAEIAKSIVDDHGSRRLSSIIPCQIAIYRKPDGSTALSRLNFALIGSLCGGNSAAMSSLAVKEQEEILRDVLVNP
ncbi:MAG TPA: hypothetical protein PK821_05170 [Victivallales bacterium]|nr:hypothetical protein [Victivallales bacterium]